MWWVPNGMHGGWMGFWMTVWGIGSLAIVVLLVWLLARAAASGPPLRIEETPEQILKRRYARGEINPAEYERRLTDLRK